MAAPSRIREITESALSAEQKKVLADLTAGRGHVLMPYKIWIHSPRFAAVFEKVGTVLNTASSLKKREIELMKCIIASHWKGEYVWAAHTKRCLELGLPQSVLDAIRAGATPQLDDEREQTIHDLARIAMEPGGGPDEVFDRAEKVLGRNGIAEVLGVLGYYSSVVMGMKLHRVPPRT